MINNKAEYVALDLETGGLDSSKNAILTAYFAMLNSDLEIIDELDLKLRPESPFDLVEAQALAVNKIDMAKHVEDPNTVSYEVAKKTLTAFLTKHKGPGKYSKPKPLGHNVSFDLKFINTQLISQTDWEKVVGYAFMDTKIVGDFLKDVGWLPKGMGRLDTYVKHFGIVARNAHTAKDDTLMCIDVYRKLKETLAAAKQGNGISLNILDMLEK